jgi:hypothetical protein
VVKLAKKFWTLLYDKLIFFAPVLIVIAIAAFLVFCTYQANFVITATLVTEEGTGSEAASAGLINALTFILPAIIGGFVIALLFKYRKKLTLKFFFGGALFFAGSFITFFFGDSILYLVQTQFYELFILDFDPYNLEVLHIEPLIYMDGIYILMILGCCIVSFISTYVIISRKFLTTSKNYALLLQSALMGAFLSVILPTYTVVILLIALSLYDIYSVRRGPIKDIVKYSMEDEENYYNSLSIKKKLDIKSRLITFTSIPFSLTSKINSNNNSTMDQQTDSKITYINNETNSGGANQHFEQKEINNQEPNQTQMEEVPSKQVKKVILESDTDDSDFMLNSMTYSSKDWDLGIGDLVFYSMLASQPLTPYFILNHGLGLLNTYGLWIFWVICLFTIIGILIGFVITIRLLERNSMLPGLPCSIALGLIGFIGSTVIFYMI